MGSRTEPGSTTDAIPNAQPAEPATWQNVTHRFEALAAQIS